MARSSNTPGPSYIGNTVTSLGGFYSAEPDSSSTNRPWRILTRDVTGLTYPAVTIQPTTANTPCAFDVMPNGVAVEQSSGFTWADFCSADIQNNNSAACNSARIAITSTAAVMASKLFNGASALPLQFNVQTGASTNATMMHLDANGINVGMGTTSPNYNLHIHRAAATTAVSIQLTNSTTGSTNTKGLSIGIDNSNPAKAYVFNRENSELYFATNALKRTYIPAAGGFVVGNGTAQIATTATDGFLYIPSFAGTPTGIPTTQTGTIPIGYDSTNNKIYAYNAGWKATAQLT